MGPFLITRDEVADPQVLELCLRRNGEIVQKGNTNAMLVSIQKLIAFYSVFLTLDPGDVILTGTPGGVGGFREPPVYWQPGDRLVASVAELGDLELSVLQET